MGHAWMMITIQARFATAKVPGGFSPAWAPTPLRPALLPSVPSLFIPCQPILVNTGLL